MRRPDSSRHDTLRLGSRTNAIMATQRPMARAAGDKNMIQRKIPPQHEVWGKPEDVFTFSSYTQTQSNGMLTHRPWAASGLSAPRWEPARQRGKTTAALPTWSGHSSRTRSWRQERYAGSHSEYTSKHTSLGWDIGSFFHTPASAL